VDTEDLKQKIEEEIAKTLILIEDYEELSKPTAADVAIGRISRMDAINNKSISEAALRQAKDKLNKLNYVLTRVDSADFGMCARCNTAIPLGRILIKPERIYCVNCA